MHDVRIDHRRSIIRERMSRIKNKIIIMSNKGGVGKSTISVLLSSMLLKRGYKVGLLDADIHGPSIAKMTSTENSNYVLNEDGSINPIQIGNLKIASLGSIIKETDKALIWRGPIKASIIRQLLADFVWGDLDYLIIDLPPGTGDEPLSVSQELENIDGSIIVTTPQEISKLDVKKAVDFLKRLNIRILAVVENMSSIRCPHCSNEFKLFKPSQDIEGYRKVEIPFLPEIADLLDEGRFMDVFEKNPDMFKKVSSILNFV